MLVSTFNTLKNYDPIAVLDVQFNAPDATFIDFEGKKTLATAWFTNVPIGSLIVEDAGEIPLADLKRHFQKHLPEDVARAELTAAAFTNPWTASSYTVAICTADRPDSLENCLMSLSQLDSACEEILLIDNSREYSAEVALIAQKFDVTYVREPLPGLDRARNRALLSCSTEIILFTDDDVEIQTGWDSWLLDGFVDPLVMGTAGLVLPVQLQMRSQIIAEKHSSHSRGYCHLTYNAPHLFPNFLPHHNYSTPGVGASMGIRVPYALSVGGFPEELDCGMPTGTGGDTWMYRKMIDDGFRVVYEPRSYVRHDHRKDEASLAKMFNANSRGVWALNWRKLLIEKRRWGAVRSMWYTSHWHLDNLYKYITFSSQRMPLNLLKSEIYGFLSSPFEYKKAIRICQSRTPVITDKFPSPAPWLEMFIDHNKQQKEEPLQFPATLALVIPTRGRRVMVTSLLQHFADINEVTEIVIVADGDIDGTVQALRDCEAKHNINNVTLVELDPKNQEHDFGSGPGVARNAGVSRSTSEYLLFLDDKMLPGPDLARKHLARHQASLAQGESDSVVVGPALVDLRSVSRMSHEGRNWWIDHTQRLLTESTLGFWDVCTGNLSISRDLFNELGGFSEIPRREDWLLGMRSLQQNRQILAAPNAWAVQQDEGRRYSRLDRFRDGAADAVILEEHPEYADFISDSLWSRNTRIITRLASNFARYPRLFRLLEPVGIYIEYRLPANSRLRHKLAKLVSQLKYWTGASEAVGFENNQFLNTKPTIERQFESQELLELSTPIKMHYIEVRYKGTRLDTTCTFRNGIAFNTRRIRRCLIDRYASDVSRLNNM